MLIVEQTLTCDICGTEMDRLKQAVPAGCVIQNVNRTERGVTAWRDVCGDCTGPLMSAFWAIKTGRAGDAV